MELLRRGLGVDIMEGFKIYNCINYKFEYVFVVQFMLAV